MALLPILRRTAGLGVAAGLGLTAYAAREARQYTLREETVPLLPPGHDPLRVLHISDIHLAPDQRAKREWLSSLAACEPDLVIDTGDNLAHARSVPLLAEALGGLLDVPGAYVLGSNDYWAPTMRNPLAYLLPDTGIRHTSRGQLPWPEMKRHFDDSGWVDLTNGFGELTVRGTRIAFAGVDDPHLEYDDLDRVAGPADASADVRLAVTHAPYLRVLDQFARDGYDAIIAGHTHGGQVCLPRLGGKGGRALTTNCDLETARARGLHRHPAASAPGDPGTSWLHVSAGLGTNPYVRLRVACRPEATLLTLVPRV